MGSSSKQLFSIFINNAHIYENQILGIREQLSRRFDMYKTPKLKINSNIKNFYDLDL